MRDVEVRECRCILKFVLSGLCFIDLYKCFNIFIYGFDGNICNKKVIKEYFMNMKINCVIFFVRLSGYKDKLMYENKIEVLKSCFFNGWGVWFKKVYLLKWNMGDDFERYIIVGVIDIVVGIKIFRLDFKWV